MEMFGIEKLGITNPKAVYRNLTPAALTEKALENKEGILMDTGALVVTTGKYTGRSPKDKFIVDTDGIHDKIAWGSVNVPISRDVYQAIRKELVEYFTDRDVYIFDRLCGCRSPVPQKIQNCQRTGFREYVYSPVAYPPHG